MKRLLTLGLTVMLTVSMLFAAMPVQAEEPVEITMLFSANATSNEENAVLDKIQENTGVRFKPIVVAAADYNTKLSAMIAGKTLPDIFQFSMVDGAEFVENGLLLNMADYLPEFGKEILSDRGEELLTGFNTKTEVWGVPWGSKTGPNVMNIRMDWLENLGLETPTDLDSFFDVMMAFTYDDPDQNGVDDTYGIGFAMTIPERFAGIFAAYGVPYGYNVQLEDGTVTSYFMHPNYVDAVTYINKLYHAGVMEQEFVTIPTMTLLEKLWNGKMGAWYGNATATLNGWLSRYVEDPVPDWGFTVIRGPEGQGGSTQLHLNNYWGISSACKNPEAAMKLVDYLTSDEGETLVWLGVEGKHFVWNDEEHTSFTYIEPYNDPAVLRADGGVTYFAQFQNFDIPNSIVYRTSSEKVKEGMLLGFETALKDAYIYQTLEASKEYGVTLDNIALEALATLIVTEPENIQAEYEQFVERWLSEGGREYTEEATRVYHQQQN